ncbi:MAG TPA: hypothetical protein VFE14_02135, partial [Micromonosporaceae bacterium]|nr:hypothetical protein [Micromonosporaceae bacterium]
DPAALVRLRPAGADRVELWARLPWDVLVTRVVGGTRAVEGTAPADVTVEARALLAGLAAGSLPARHDERWHWALPPGGGLVVESVPAAQLRVLGSAAEQAVRDAAAHGVGGRTVGERAVRDALLDHVAIVAAATVNKSTKEQISVPQRLVQAVVRMGFLRTSPSDDETPVRILVSGRFVGLAAEYGVAWRQRMSGLSVRAIVQTAEPH